uniref:Gag-like protein n=1 Tax=Bombyx mori TaxID=7091 RepID=A0A8R2R3K3_BOMMO|nr:translation initiation factor IF-2-like [Bombyx mori]
MRSALASDSGVINPIRLSMGKKRGRRKTPLPTSDDGGASSSSTEVPEKTMTIEEVAPVVAGPAATKDAMPAPQWAPVRRRGAVSPATSVESMSTSAASLASGDEAFRDLDLALVNLAKLLSTVATKGAEPGSSYRKRLREGAAMVRTKLIPTMTKLVAQLDFRESRSLGDSPALQEGTPLSPMPRLARSEPPVRKMDTSVPSRAVMSVAAPMPTPTSVAAVPRVPTPALPRPPRRVELRPAPPPRISESIQTGRLRPVPAQAEDIRSPLARMVDEWPALPRPRPAEPPLSPPRAVGSQREEGEVDHVPSRAEMMACISRAVAVEVGKQFAGLEEILRSSISFRNCVPEEVRVHRPVRMAEIRITGLDDCATKEEVAAAIAAQGGCAPESVTVGELRLGYSGARLGRMIGDRMVIIPYQPDRQPA